jgi:hypothetical protein
MDVLKFIRYSTEFGYCYRIDKNNFYLEELAFFLETEVACFGSVRLKRLINALKEEGDSTSGNMIDIEKRGSNLYLGYVHDDPENPCERLEISKEELFKLMVEWEKLMEKKPEEIILIRDKDKFELIERNSSKIHEQVES